MYHTLLVNKIGNEFLKPTFWHEIMKFALLQYKKDYNWYFKFLSWLEKFLGIYLLQKRNELPINFLSIWIDSQRVYDPMIFDIRLRKNSLSPSSFSITKLWNGSQMGPQIMQQNRVFNIRIQTHPLSLLPSTTSISSLHFFSTLKQTPDSASFLYILNSHYYNHNNKWIYSSPSEI